MNAVFARLREPSTHAGLAGLSVVLKTFAPAWAGVLDASIALFAALAVALPEKGANA